MSESEPIVTVARWVANEESLDAVLGQAAELRRHSLAEPGCLGYEVFQHVGQRIELLILEHYRDTAALEAHRNSKHYGAIARDRILPQLKSRSVEILTSGTKG